MVVLTTIAANLNVLSTPLDELDGVELVSCETVAHCAMLLQPRTDGQFGAVKR